jgi:hypothetical protein
MSQPQIQDSNRQFRQWVYLLIIVATVAAQLERMANLTSWQNPGQADWPWPGKPGRYKPPHTPLLSANDRSRWCTVWTLVEQGTYQIDAFEKVQGWNTIDKVKKDGHFYSSKPPLLSTCVAGVYWCLKHGLGMNLMQVETIEQEMVVDATKNPPVTRRFAFKIHQAIHGTIQLILILVNLVPFAISLWLISRLVERHAKSDLTRVLIVTVAAWGTFLSTFLITLNNHTVAANCVLWSLCAALKVLADDDQRRRWFILAGFFAAFSVTCELPSGIFLVWLGLLLLRANWRRTLIWFTIGAAVPLGVHFYLNQLIVGGFLPFYASFGKDYYNYPGSYWLEPKGMDSNVQPAWLYFVNCTIGHHGIFSLTPIFLLTIQTWISRMFQVVANRFKSTLTWIWDWKIRLEPQQIMDWLSLGCTIVILAFYLTRTDSYNYGGRTSGLRWAFWLIPLLLCSTIPTLDAFLNRRWFRGMCLVLLAISVFSAMFPWLNPWTYPWLMQIMQQAKWTNYPI